MKYVCLCANFREWQREKKEDDDSDVKVKEARGRREWERQARDRFLREMSEEGQSGSKKKEDAQDLAVRICSAQFQHDL